MGEYDSKRRSIFAIWEPIEEAKRQFLTNSLLLEKYPELWIDEEMPQITRPRFKRSYNSIVISYACMLAA